jgi:hypothetical protein
LKKMVVKAWQLIWLRKGTSCGQWATEIHKMRGILDQLRNC